MGMKVLAADGISPKGIELLQKEFEVVVKDKISAEELLEMIPRLVEEQLAIIRQDV